MALNHLSDLLFRDSMGKQNSLEEPTMFANLPPLEPDPVIDAYKRDIDVSLIRENLRLTHQQRLEKMVPALAVG